MKSPIFSLALFDTFQFHCFLALSFAGMYLTKNTIFSCIPVCVMTGLLCKSTAIFQNCSQSCYTGNKNWDRVLYLYYGTFSMAECSMVIETSKIDLTWKRFSMVQTFEYYKKLTSFQKRWYKLWRTYLCLPSWLFYLGCQRFLFYIFFKNQLSRYYHFKNQMTAPFFNIASNFLFFVFIYFLHSNEILPYYLISLVLYGTLVICYFHNQIVLDKKIMIKIPPPFSFFASAYPLALNPKTPVYLIKPNNNLISLYQCFVNFKLVLYDDKYITFCQADKKIIEEELDILLQRYHLIMR